jgi:ribosomal protein S18 acetylase RimI-like enzyme
MDFLIRAATGEDTAAIAALFLEVAAFHAAALPRVFHVPQDPASTRQFVAGLLTDAKTRLFVAERAGQISGVVHLTLRATAALDILVPRQYVVVESLAVRERDRRAGIGHALMRHAEEWAREQQVRVIELNVWEFNAGARTFYERLGYATFSRKMGKALD